MCFMKKKTIHIQVINYLSTYLRKFLSCHESKTLLHICIHSGIYPGIFRTNISSHHKLRVNEKKILKHGLYLYRLSPDVDSYIRATSTSRSGDELNEYPHNYSGSPHIEIAKCPILIIWHQFAPISLIHVSSSPYVLFVQLFIQCFWWRNNTCSIFLWALPIIALSFIWAKCHVMFYVRYVLLNFCKWW